MLAKIKTILQTLMAVTVILFFGGVWYHVSAEKEETQAILLEKEVEEVVQTLEKINIHKRPNFERENNQTFINSVGACVQQM
jgi:hypothetical protein